MNAALMWTINVFPAYEMVSSWNTYEKLTCPYYTENNKALTLTNNGKTLFFYFRRWFLPNDQKYRKNIKDFFVGRVERDIVPPLPLGEELYDLVLEYDDIVFGFLIQ
jgi:hypothetical protein